MNKKNEEKIATQISKTLALMCVRNTFLEDLHSGTVPSTKTGDYSDVFVIDAEGREIPWPAISRLNDDEMKTLMKEIVNRLYTWFTRCDDPEFGAQIDRWMTAAQKWDDPELDQAFLADISKES